MIDIDVYQAEVQARADALTGATPAADVRKVGISARAVELAGGTIDRTVLNVQLQRVADDVSGSSTDAELISLGAALPRAAQNPVSIAVGTYITGLFKGDPKYLQCNGGTYLRSAYPELSDDAISGLTQQISISASESTNGPINASYETTPSIYKFNGKFYKLVGGNSNTSGWQNLPIQVSTDGIVFKPVASISIASPLTTHAGNAQLDVMIANGSTLLAFGRLSANGTSYLIQLRSLDDGVNWIFSTIRTTSGSYSSLSSPVLVAAIGNTVIAHVRGDAATNIYYTANFGGGWGALSDTDAVNAKTVYGLVEDGSRFMIGFSDGSSAYTAAADPTGTTWTAVAPPNANARGALAVISGKWIMGGLNGYVATCTSLGTWVSQATCTAGMPTLSIDRIRVNGSVIAFCSLTALGQVFYCTDASTLPAATAVVADSIANNPAKLTLASVADGNFYLRVNNNEGVIRSASLASGSFSSIQARIDVDAAGNFDTLHNGIVKKFGLYFYSIGGAGQNKRYVSSDLKNWRIAPENIATGCGAVVDAGSRLLALDDNMLLWQSTDGETWDTTGITRPTLTGTPYGNYARLYVCENGWIYLVAFRNSDASYFAFVTKDEAATWTALSGFAMIGNSSYINCLQNPCLFTAIDGNIYSLSVNYYSSSYGYYFYSSSNGINFSNVSSQINFIAGAYYSRRNGVFKVDGVIYMFIGGDTYWWMASYDGGDNFINIPISFVPAIVVKFAGAFSYHLINRLSSDPYIYLYTSNDQKLVKLSGVSLSESANYAAGSGNVSTALIYEDSILKVLSASNGLRGPVLTSMADSNTTFTLPSISNTFLRAAA